MRIALFCKQGLFSEGLASLLDHHGSFQVVATESSASSIVSAAKNLHAHIIVVDAENLDHRDLNFILGARAFGEFAVVLISPEDDPSTEESLVDRLISRRQGSEGLYQALEELGGGIRVSRPYVRERRRPYGTNRNANELSRREYEVAQLVGRGMSNRKIAAVTGLREQSVKNLVSVIMRKLRCENRVQVALRLTSGVKFDPSAAETTDGE